ncbi:MAG: hypothetical protein ABJE95_27125 [Byssovorax sp.]
MTGLEAKADQAVRDAVDAFIEGRLRSEYTGETVFETKNSRYRLMDGVLFSAPDASLVGAELVGWLIESPRRCSVESAWQATSRAVLVDRQRGRHIIVTSSTRMLHLEEESPESGSNEDQTGSSVHPPIWEEGASPAPTLPPPSAPPSSSHLRPPSYAPAPMLTAQPQPASRPPLPVAPLPRVHAPPRPMLQRIPQATAPKPLARPLPYPSAPPRRAAPSPLPAVAAQQMAPLPPPGRLPLPRSIAPAHPHIETLDEGVVQVDCDDELEGTDPGAPPFLLARPAGRPASIVPAAPASQPFPLARVMQRGALLR